LEAVVATPSTTNPEPRMDAHENARTTPHSRMLIVERLDQRPSEWNRCAVPPDGHKLIKNLRFLEQ